MFRRTALRRLFHLDDDIELNLDDSQLTAAASIVSGMNNTNWLLVPGFEDNNAKMVMRMPTHNKCEDSSPSCHFLALQGHCPFDPTNILSTLTGEAELENAKHRDIIRKRALLLRGFVALHCRKSCGQCFS